MFRLKRALGSYILASALLQAITAQAATYYVATTGDDSNPGTDAQPWQTVAHAVNTMVAGDTTYVKSGTYNEGEIRFSVSGTPTLSIKLLNYPGQNPIIDCIDKNQFHRILIENASGDTVPIGWITIAGFEIRDCYNGIKFSSGHDLTIQRNWIHDNTPGAGILGNGPRNLIDRNIINSNAKTAPLNPGNHGIYGWGTDWIISNNLIYDNFTFGIQQKGVNTSHPQGVEYYSAARWTIVNNTIAYNINGAGEVVWGPNTENTRIENNIYYENRTNGTAHQGIHFLSIPSTTTGILIRNNYAYASGSGGVAFLGTTGATEGVNYTQSGNTVNTSNPAFVNAPATLPASPNFALTAGSPVIDKGLSLDMTGTAFDGTTRPQGRAYDIGAYEYRSKGDSQAPRTVQNLQAH